MEQDGVVQLFLYLFSIQQHLFIKHSVISHSQDVSVVNRVCVLWSAADSIIAFWLLHAEKHFLRVKTHFIAKLHLNQN